MEGPLCGPLANHCISIFKRW